MNRLCACILFSVFALVAARAEQTNTPATASTSSNAAPSGVTSNALPASIVIDGTTYEEVRWERVTPTTVTIFHKTGVATIPLEKLPLDLQKKFGYDPQKAADWQKAQQQKAAEWQKEQLQKAEAERQKAAAEKLANTWLRYPFEVGDVGVSRHGWIKVIQVLGPNEMRAGVYAQGVTHEEGRENVAAFYNEQGPVNSSDQPREAWLKGISTAGLADGSEITRNIVFKVTGTKTYPTVGGGTATLFVLEPLASVSTR